MLLEDAVPANAPSTPAVKESSKEKAYYDQLHAEKYRDKGQSFRAHCETFATNLASNPKHREDILDLLVSSRFIPAGRVQAAFGATQRQVSAFNCAVSGTIHDSMPAIMEALSNAAMTLRLGTGVGYNFSHLRPQGDVIKKLQSKSSGPLSFMRIFDAMASTIAASGDRRGAQMAILNVDHPNIEQFIDAKLEKGAYRYFNLSVGITDAFMDALEHDQLWDLQFEGKVYKTVSAKWLWEKITRNAYNSAEPGIIFIDRLNAGNNLAYCETIEATNPCAEQPLPPHGLCLLGSFNLINYVDGDRFKYLMFERDIHTVVEAYDNIFEKSIYALPQQQENALNKRRIGLGLTGISNAIELMIGRPCYGEPEFIEELEAITSTLANKAYVASAYLASKRGSFALYDMEKYTDGAFFNSLDPHTQAIVRECGLRNSHLISYAPCGTISQCAGNVSSGVEPIFYHRVNRDVYMKEGQTNVTLVDFNVREHGFYGKTLEEVTVDEHLAVAATCQRYCDSAVSKTVNVAESCSYADYERIYRDAYGMGIKGITVYRPSEVRGAVITKAVDNSAAVAIPVDGAAPAMPRECRSGVCEL